MSEEYQFEAEEVLNIETPIQEEVTSSDEDSSDDEPQCAICNEYICGRDRMAILKPCNHTFHQNYIQERMKRDSTCPTCQKNATSLIYTRINGPKFSPPIKSMIPEEDNETLPYIVTMDLKLAARASIYQSGRPCVTIPASNFDEYDKFPKLNFCQEPRTELRILSWIRRDLKALRHLHPNKLQPTNLKYKILGMLRMNKTERKAAVISLSTHLGNHTSLFLHELAAFLTSPCHTLEEWDTGDYAIYPPLVASRRSRVQATPRSRPVLRRRNAQILRDSGDFGNSQYTQVNNGGQNAQSFQGDTEVQTSQNLPRDCQRIDKASLSSITGDTHDTNVPPNFDADGIRTTHIVSDPNMQDTGSMVLGGDIQQAKPDAVLRQILGDESSNSQIPFADENSCTSSYSSQSNGFFEQVLESDPLQSLERLQPIEFARSINKDPSDIIRSDDQMAQGSRVPTDNRTGIIVSQREIESTEFTTESSVNTAPPDDQDEVPQETGGRENSPIGRSKRI